MRDKPACSNSRIRFVTARGEKTSTGASPSSRQRKRRNLRQPVGEHLTRMHKIVMGLEIQPEFRRVSSPNIS